MKSFFYKSSGHLVYCIIALIFCASCGRPVEHSKYIPKEASFVLSLNIPKIKNKSVDWNYLFSRDVLQMVGDFKDTEILRKNLTKSGIDFDSPVYLFSEQSDLPENDYFAVSFKIKNESTFDDFLRNFNQEHKGDEEDNTQLRIRSFSGMRYVLIDNQTILGWMNSAALYIKLSKQAEEDILKNRMIRLRDLPPDRSLLQQKDKMFKFLRLKEHDLAAWVNLEVYEKKIKNLVNNFPLPLNLDFRNNYLTALINFEKGKAVTKMEFHNGNNSFVSYSRLVKDSLSQNVLSEIPLKNRLAMLGIGLDMKGIKELFNNLGGAIFEGQTQAMTGSTPNEIMDMLTGDFVAVVKDIYEKPKPEQNPYEYIIATGVSQPATLQKIIQKLKEDGEATALDSISYALPNLGIYLVYHHPLLYMTASEELRVSLSDKSALLETTPLQNSKGSFLMLFSDIQEKTRQKLPRSFFGDDRFLEGMVKYTRSPFESASVHVQALRNKNASATFVINMKDKTQNALKTLAETFKPRKPSSR